MVTKLSNVVYKLGTLVILATWKAEIGRITVQEKPKQKVYESTSRPRAGYSGLPLLYQAMGEAGIRTIEVPGQAWR
jgi:hypothetical protein